MNIIAVTKKRKITSNTNSNKKPKTSNSMNNKKDSNKVIKKLVIKPISNNNNNNIPENFEEESWKKLKDTIETVFHNIKGKFSFEELYKIVEDLITLKLSANLYKNFQKEIIKENEVLLEKIIK
jgi:hypothetical protein